MKLEYILIPLLFVFLSGASNGVMDTIDHHWDISVFSTWPDGCFKEWMQGHFFDISDTWYSYLGFPYLIEDGWHFFKGCTGIFAILSFYFAMIKDLPAKLYQKYFIGIYTILILLFWWAGKELFYSYLLILK